MHREDCLELRLLPAGITGSHAVKGSTGLQEGADLGRYALWSTQGKKTLMSLRCGAYICVVICFCLCYERVSRLTHVR